MERKAVNRDQMVMQLSQERSGGMYKPPKGAKIYKEQADEHRKESISQSVKNQITALELAYKRGKIPLAETETVKAQAMEYMKACEETGSFPTTMGLATALGVSRQAIYDYMKVNPKHETTQFLRVWQSACANILAQEGLYRNTDTALSIFLLKNSGQGLQDKIEIAAAPVDDKEELTAEEIAEKYQYIITDFEEVDSKPIEGSV